MQKSDYLSAIERVLQEHPDGYGFNKTQRSVTLHSKSLELSLNNKDLNHSMSNHVPSNDQIAQLAAALGLSSEGIAQAQELNRQRQLSTTTTIINNDKEESPDQTSSAVEQESSTILSKLDDDNKARYFASLDIMKKLGFIVTSSVYKQYVKAMEAQGLEPLSRYALVALLVASFFTKEGILSQTLPNYNPRYGQMAFADAVVRALAKRSILVVEAGTGTGKTFSYLVPPLMAGKRIMVSTKTKALQEQLISKDIPKLCDMMNLHDVTAIPLKGQSNYICRYLLEGDGKYKIKSELFDKLLQYDEQCQDDILYNKDSALFGEIKTKINDIYRHYVACDSNLCREMSISCPFANNKKEFIAKCNKEIQDILAQHPDVSAANILQHADDYDLTPVSADECFAFAARHVAKSRDICVINHSLFFASMSNNFTLGELGTALPLPDIIIFDEAHTLPEVAREFYKQEISAESLTKLVDSVHKCFADNVAVSTHSGDLGEQLDKISFITEFLSSVFNCMDEGRISISTIKYKHKALPSPFQVLGAKMGSVRAKKALLEGSFFMKEIDKSNEPLWGEQEEQELIATKKSQLALFESDFLEDDDDTLESKMPVKKEGRHKRKIKGSREKQLFELHLKEVYKKQLASYQKKHQLSAEYINQVVRQSGLNELCDVEIDDMGNPIIEPYFRNLMADLYKALTDLVELLNKNEESAPDHVPFIKERVQEHIACLTNFMSSDRDRNHKEHYNYAAWLDIYHNHGYTMSVCPIDISHKIRDAIDSLQKHGISVIFTSATITVEQNFNKFCADMGFSPEELTTKIVESPFNYKKNSCIFTSQNFPSSDDKNRMTTALNMVSELITASPGGIFILTTSVEQMKIAKQEMESKYGQQRTILMQGDDTINHLMSKFKEDGRAILIGTSSLWEGIDVPGNALTLVLIDKLPFKQMGDPIQQARKNKVERVQGINHFSTVMLPEAIIALRQGAGRLIRNENDKGVLVILDPRMITKGYGRQVLKSLPPMCQVSSLAEALRFF